MKIIDGIYCPKVAIVGGGPAGLNAATVLGKTFGDDVLIIERESELGGIPRHANHPGYGIRDRKSFTTGPRYARLLTNEALATGVEAWVDAQVTACGADKTLEVTSPKGRRSVKADVVLLATGARERPRSARMVWGDRPAGVYTTGQIQNLVHLHHERVGKRAVVVGAELVSWSAVMTLREAGCRTEALISQFPKPESYRLFSGPGKIVFRTSVRSNSKVVAIHGKPRVEAVEIEDLHSGRRSTITCDTVVFTGDWIADYELAWAAGIEHDAATGAPTVDNTMMTSQDGVFAVGNLNHPVETADVVSQEGQYVAQQIIEYLENGPCQKRAIRLTAGRGIDWVSPQVFMPDGPDPARGRIVGWVDQLINTPTVEVQQGGKVVGTQKLPWPAAPGRIFRIPTKVLAKVREDAGDVTISVK